MDPRKRLSEYLALIGSDARSIIAIAGDITREAGTDEDIYRLHAIVRLAELQCETIRCLSAETDAGSILK